MRRNALIAALAVGLLSSCYRITVLTGAAPGTATIDKPWQMSFVYGLIPPPELNGREGCPGGVAKVVTEHSFLNGLVAAVTWQLVTPIHVQVTCSGR
jgi:hypothetical protein